MVSMKLQLLIICADFYFRLSLQTLSLRQNLIKKIENLDSLTSLRELDLYDNQIRKLENLHHLTELE